MRLQFACVVLLLGLTLPAAAGAGRAFEPKLEPAIGLNAVTALVDQEFVHATTALQIVAASDDAISGNWEKIKRPLAALAHGDANLAASWFALPDGSYFSVAGGRQSQSLRGRAYFAGLMAGNPVTGFLVISKSSGRKSAIVAVPVRDRGKVIGALGVSIDVESIAAEIGRKISLPEGIVYYALDPKGQIAFHRESKRAFEFARELGGASLKNAIDEMLTSPSGTVRYRFEGAERTAIFRKSAVTGWVYALRW